MNRRLTVFLLLLCWALLPSAVSAVTLVMADSFDQDAVGAEPPPGWSLAVTVAGTSAQVAAGTEAGNNVAVLHDDNGSSTSNNTLFRNFTAVTSGVCTTEFDLKFPQNTAGFGTRLTSGGTPTSGGSWATGVIFQGNVAYEGGPTPPNGRICYQSQFNPFLYPAADGSYSVDVWYTLKVVADIGAKSYRVFFGVKGSSLTEITPAGGVPFVKNASTGAQPDRIGGLTFYTSNRNGDAAGDLLIDNVRVESDAPSTVASTVSEVKSGHLGESFLISGKTVTAGTDQMTGPFFYMQDETGGIRVRTDQTVHQGDRVTVQGTLERAVDDGTLSGPNGELELIAALVVITPGPFPLPAPIGGPNAAIGGGDFGLPQTDGYPAQPGVFSWKSGGTEVGLNNVGLYGRFWGRVTYANDILHVLYLDDGSGVIDGSGFPNGAPAVKGVRVLFPSDNAVSYLMNRYISVPAIVGCTSAAELGASGSTRNVRVLRLVQENFTDQNGNGRRDANEPFTDANANGTYDGVTITADAPASTADLRFDVVTFCCPCSLTAHLCQPQFDALNWVSGNGHYIAMGSDAHKAEVVANGNVLAAYYNTLNDGYGTLTGAEKADDIETRLTTYFPSGVPQWVVLNEISAGRWPSNQTYRTWVHDVVHKLANFYAHKVLLYSPFPNPGANGDDWQAVSADAYIGDEFYLSGEEIKSSGFSVSWCRAQYASSRQSYTNLGVPSGKLFLGEHFGQTTAGTGWGRAGVSSADWDSAMNARHTAIHDLGFAGFIGYAWSKNAMGASDAELIHYEQTYASKPLP